MRGYTLVELLAASTVLGLLTVFLGSVLVPSLRRVGWNDQTQEVLQRVITTREFLAARLARSELLSATADELTYHLPVRLGSLHKIDADQMIQFESVTRTLHLQNFRLCESGSDGTVRNLWDLGEGGQFQLDAREKPLVTFLFQGRKTVTDPASPRFQESFTLLLRNLP